MLMKKNVKAGLVLTICPYLGLKDDPGTSFAYPNPANLCFHCRVPAAPLLEHQGACCLAETHPACPVFGREPQQPFPSNLRFGGGEFRSARRTPWRWIALAVGALLIGFALWQVLPARPAGQVPVSPAASLTPTSASTPSPAATKLPGLALPSTKTPGAPAPTLEPASPTPTDFPPQEHALEVPVLVGEQPILLHRVIEGEQIVLLTRRYETSLEVLEALNYSPPAPVFAGRVIVIAPGLMNVDPNLPPFDPYQVIDPEIGVGELAGKLGVDLDRLKYYNRCSGFCKFVSGDWLLIPRLRTPTPAAATPVPSPTPTQLPPPGEHPLEVPVLVGEQPLLLHRVVEGEQIVLLTKLHQTTLEVLEAINYLPPAPLLAGRVIAIAPGLKVVDPNLPAFEPYQVVETGISAADLAVKLGADLALLKYYNNCLDSCQLVKGDWLLVPRSK
jgi:hypothetical protein